MNLDELKNHFSFTAKVDGRSSRTLELYEETLSRFEDHLDGGSVEEITPTTIRRFLLNLEMAGYAPATRLDAL